MKEEKKSKRAQAVLFGLVELYLIDGKPVASNTLKELALADISSATIRNYFVELEEAGFLEQAHTSGGRIPTNKALRLYAEEALFSGKVSPEDEAFFKTLLKDGSIELSSYLQKSAEGLSELTGLSVLVTSPRFDQDFMKEVRLFLLDSTRLLSVVITQFSMCYTEVLYLPKRLSSFALKRIEDYIAKKLDRIELPLLSEEEERLALQLHQEISLRYMVRYANFATDDLVKAGFSRLLNFPEFHDPMLLGSTLSLMEHPTHIQKTLLKTMKSDKICVEIGEEPNEKVSLISLSYKIQGKSVGVLTLIGPLRINYPKMFSLLTRFKELFEENICKVISQFHITFRNPETTLTHTNPLFLENHL